MKSVVKYPYDAATAFRAPGLAAVTASTDTAAVELDYISKGRGAYADSLGRQSYAAVVLIEAVDFGDSDEEYTFDVEVDSTDAFDTPTVVGSVTVNGTGPFVVNLDADTVQRLEAVPAFARVALTASGTTPSVKFSAWLAPVVA